MSLAPNDPHPPGGISPFQAGDGNGTRLRHWVDDLLANPANQPGRGGGGGGGGKGGSGWGEEGAGKREDSKPKATSQ